MAGITQLVDERIEQIKRERAELDELRSSLERREAEVENREQTFKNELLPLEDRKQALIKDIEKAQIEVDKLRAERDFSIENFGNEMDEVHAEKTAESADFIKKLQHEIAFLSKGKNEAEDEITNLKNEIKELEEKSNRDKNRIVEEKEVFLNRTRAEREASLKEINLNHSIAMADLDREKKALEDEIAALEQTKIIEWNKIQAEVSRYRTTKLAELDAERESYLAEAEKEKSNLFSSLRTEERKQLAEIAKHKREWEQEALKLHAERQKVLDDTKLLQYEYEKAKSENTIKLEKARIEAHKMLEAEKAETLTKLDEEQSVLAVEWKKQTTELKNRHREEISKNENEIQTLEDKKSSLLKDIDMLETKYNETRAGNEFELEKIKSERLKEIDELRLLKLQSVEEQRLERIAALEKMYFEKSTALEKAREEKFEASHQAIIAAESELSTLKNDRYAIEKEIDALKTEGERIKEENKSLKKAALLDSHLEVEKHANIKMAELEHVCTSRLAHAEDLVKRMTKEAHELEDGLAEQRAAAFETIASLRSQISTLESELMTQKEDKLAEIHKEVIKAQDELSRLKLTKLSEIELYLETYKQERLDNIKNDLDRHQKAGYKQIDELAVLNDDYNKRMKELQELSISLEADKRSAYFREQKYQSEINELKSMLEKEIEVKHD